MTAQETTADLQTMRVAAEQREWTALQDTLKRLLAELDPLIALGAAANRTQAFLPTFESVYPESGWVKELMLTVISYGSAPNELPENVVTEYNEPGCGNFLLAVFDLARAVQPKYTVFERYSHIVNAIANAILAELQYAYFSERRAAFEQMRDPAVDERTRAQIQFDFWLDDGVAERDTAIWLKVADEVAALVHNK
jgi:hypothetical protein